MYDILKGWQASRWILIRTNYIHKLTHKNIHTWTRKCQKNSSSGRAAAYQATFDPTVKNALYPLDKFIQGPEVV